MNLDEKIRAKRAEERTADRERAKQFSDRRAWAKAKAKMINERVSPYGLRAHFDYSGSWTIDICQLDFLGFKNYERVAYISDTDDGDYLDQRIESIIVSNGKTSSLPSSPFFRIPLFLAAIALVITMIF